jgi:hypothetical protein
MIVKISCYSILFKGRPYSVLHDNVWKCSNCLKGIERDCLWLPSIQIDPQLKPLFNVNFKLLDS